MGGTESQVGALEAEVAALRARNFPVLNEALKGLKARHGEYKAEVREEDDKDKNIWTCPCLLQL